MIKTCLYCNKPYLVEKNNYICPRCGASCKEEIQKLKETENREIYEDIKKQQRKRFAITISIVSAFFLTIVILIFIFMLIPMLKFFAIM